MKLCILSDIHANFSALKAVEKEALALGAEGFVSLGDIVGYGPDVNECLRWVKDNCTVSILGNHDSYALGNEKEKNFNRLAKKALSISEPIFEKELLNYLSSLPYVVKDEEVQYVHASPYSPADWHYVMDLEQAVDCFEYFCQKICFIGHSHFPGIVLHAGPENFSFLEENSYSLKLGDKLLVNVGSVGQPRDGDVRASFSIYDSSESKVTLHRVAYEIKEVQERMVSQGFPSTLINRLGVGR